MSFSEVDRTWARHFLGFGATFNQADPRVEGALTAAQSLTDGGSRPDSSSENFIKSLIYGVAAGTGTAGVTLNGTAQPGPFATPAVRGLIQIESQIAALDVQQGATEVDEIRIDSAREMIRLQMDGRRLVFSLARMLGMKGPRIDIFSSGATTEDSDPFWASESPWW